MTLPKNVSHPGARIRAEIIPAGMSVSGAAKLVGVSRPTLSNLLNGNAALSTDMAARLERAFNVPRQDLLDMQTQYELALARNKSTPANTRAYIPSFLQFKANDIEVWVDRNISARARLAVFLRRLIHSTGVELTTVQFHGNDDAERPGWDGFVEASEGTPWIPQGPSGWEFGSNKNIKSKADSDFKKSVKAQAPSERQHITFVFVTPRRWTGKNTWVAEQRAKKLWAEVRAYDASDLEQWLEQSPPTQTWFANEISWPVDSVRSLDQCWRDWANASSPPLSPSLFDSAIDVAKARMKEEWLASPVDRPIVITADSTEEALAFLAQLFTERGGPELAEARDRIIVFDKPGAFSQLAAGAQTFIAVVANRDVERELATSSAPVRSIVVYPRNAIPQEPLIALQPASYEVFNKALGEMGKNHDEITRIARASGRSLTVLRRQLAKVPAVQSPLWATDHEVARSLVPIMFVGAWNSANEADTCALEMLAGNRPYTDLEKDCQKLRVMNDAPVWSIDSYRGIVSKIDLLYAIASSVTQDDLKRYFQLARLVLSEDDPALDLTEDERWAAAYHGKTREWSTSFRNGICETLVLLAVHGGEFRTRLGVDTEYEARLVVQELLPTPLKQRTLEANVRDLPLYAEAAPEEFLSILERDLESNEPAVLELLRPVPSNALGGSPSRTGLLWALESLAWNPYTLHRAARILARLAQVEIKDNWMNKPAHSLESIFRAWMPQTAADLTTRVDVVKLLAKDFPSVAWKLCVAQFGGERSSGHPSHKPRWRTDGSGFGEPVPPAVSEAFMREMIEMALEWKNHSMQTLSDLVERLPVLSPADQARIWSLIENWATSEASNDDKVILREKIRTSTLSIRAALRSQDKDTKNLVATAKRAYTSLEPSDVLDQHAWLFRETWVEESADDLENIKEMDFQKRNERVEKMRTKALHDVLERHGLFGILKLAERGKASDEIGNLATRHVLPTERLKELLALAMDALVTNPAHADSAKGILYGALHALGDDARSNMINAISAGRSDKEKVQVLLLAPFGRATWNLVDALDEHLQAEYWRTVVPTPHASASENTECVQRLLKAERPRAAFWCMRFAPQNMEAQLLFKVLTEIVTKDGADKRGEYLLEQYNVEQAFIHLNASNELNAEQKARLEFAFIDLLARPWGGGKRYGIPNLERYVHHHPEVFVQAVAWFYPREDGAADPPEIAVEPHRVKELGERGYKLLEALHRVPGSNERGDLDGARLKTWVATVREAAAKLGRIEATDSYLGKLLAHAPIGTDGAWPCEPVRNVMESIRSEAMMDGARVGMYNSRGAHIRRPGGDQERELAEKYREWARAFQDTHPFVASELRRLVDTYKREAGYYDIRQELERRLA